jgi:dTDP-4-dehydrorhamnose 3,5-epimerase
MIDPNMITGVRYYHIKKIKDERGFFCKTFVNDLISEKSVFVNESFYTLSKIGTIRGMHLQVGPFANDRIVSVIKGNIFDVLIDLRQDSLTFKKICIKRLSCSEIGSVFIPKGVAHGFQALDESITHYISSQPYKKEFDLGVNIDSVGVNWPLKNYEISNRDRKLPDINKFLLSQFRFG